MRTIEHWATTRRGKIVAGILSILMILALGATVACFALMTFTGSALLGDLAAAYVDALSPMAWGALVLLVGLMAARGDLPAPAAGA